MLAHVDLCSGIGGFALGFERAGLSKPVLFCDIEPWSRQILKKHWPDVPIAEDVKELANDPGQIINAINGRQSILTAGYPCQPFSAAGQRRGFEDERHIWPEIFSIIQQVRPDWIAFENVSGHITLGLNEVLSDLADKANYSVQTFHIGAVSVDAPHRRMRLWIVGNRNDNGASAPRDLRVIQREPEWTQTDLFQSEGSSSPEGQSTDVANANSKHSRSRRVSEYSDRQGREQTKAKRESLQSRDRATRSSNTEQSSGDVANANNKGIRSRIRGASSQSLEEGSRGRDHHEASRGNGGAQDSEKSQNIQEALANAKSKRTDAPEANAKTSAESVGLRESGGSSSNNDVAYPNSARQQQGNKELERGSSEQSDSSSVQSSDVVYPYSKGSQRFDYNAQSSRGLQQESLQRCGDVANASNKQRGHAPISRLGGMVDGLSTWVDEPPGIPRTGPSVKGRAARLKGLGNAIVPQIAERIGQTIKLIQLQGTKE